MTLHSIHGDDGPLMVSKMPADELTKRVNSSEGLQGHELLGEIHDWLQEQKSKWLRIEDLVQVSRPDRQGAYRKVEIDPEVFKDVQSSYEEGQAYLKSGKRIYGVTTGFGSFRKYPLSTRDRGKISANILFSHATGVGPPLPAEVVRAMMLLRLRTFAQGNSGVPARILETLAEMLNRGVVPYIPSKGSVGCSGDLCSLAHLFLVVIGKGRAWVIPGGSACLRESECPGEDPSELLPGREAMESAGIETIKLEDLKPKEGLALTNGSTLSAATLALAVHDAQTLFRSANVSASLTVQALSGFSRPFEACVQAVRPHPGQILTGWEMLKLLQGSTLVDRSAFVGESQDDYSLRAIPQVHGAAWDNIDQARVVAETEINSATDNPLFFRHFTSKFQFDNQLPEVLVKEVLGTEHCSAANFHGQPVAIALDLLKIALAELASIAERRIQMLLDPNHNRGLPGNLTVGALGLHSGCMLMQVAAAALVSENKVLCHPSSVDSIPTSANAEDHVSMAANAANHARSVVQNVADVLAIEVLCGLQALDIRTSMAEDWIRHWMAAEQAAAGTGWDEDPPRPKSETRLSPEAKFVRQKLGENAKILFPQWADWASEEAQKAATGSQLPAPAFSYAADRVRRWVRDDRQVPFILHDGCVGEHEKNTPLFKREGQPGLSSFKDLEPSQLIGRISRTIRSGELLARAWEAQESDQS